MYRKSSVFSTIEHKLFYTMHGILNFIKKKLGTLNKGVLITLIME